MKKTFFKRKVYSKLLSWKNECNGSKALLIEGARRIGKSTIALEFAKNEYEQYLLIDFSIATDEVKEYFIKYINDLDYLFMLLFSEYKMKNLPKRKSLIIFDEVQFCPKAREAIKHLVKDGRYDYIETGSLISIKENVEKILIPSEERQLKMFPLDFEEFLWAMNEEELAKLIRKSFINRNELPQSLHEKAMLLFKEYMLIGGMPQSLSVYIENNKDFEKANREKRDILNLYRNDIMKIKSSNKAKVLAIFDQIPGLLSQHEKRVVFKDIAYGSFAKQYEETFFWLDNSFIANNCFLCGDPNLGLSINENRSYVKCYFGDTGLLTSHAFDENELMEEEIYRGILKGNLSLNNGMLYENAIAQSLVANNHRLFFYTHYNEEKHRNDIEVDFLISNKSKINFKLYPIEVKSGKQYSTVSLERFVEKFKDRIDVAYIIHPKNLSQINHKIMCIPSYMVFCL